MSDTLTPPSTDDHAAASRRADATAVADAIERLEGLLERRPGFGRGTSTSVTTAGEGLRCSSEEGPWRVDSDMSKSFGGGDGAPSPGVLLRASLGSCLAIGYKLRAAKHGVELTSVRVTVEADSEVAGMLDTDAPAPPGWTEFRYHVEVESPAPATEVERVLDEGDRLSPLLDALARSNLLRRTTSIRTGGELT